MSFMNKITHTFTRRIYRDNEWRAEFRFHHHYVSRNLTIEEAVDSARKAFQNDTRYEAGVSTKEISVKFFDGRELTLMSRSLVSNSTRMMLQRIWLQMRKSPCLEQFDVCLGLLEDMELQDSLTYDIFVDMALGLINEQA